MPNTAWTDRYSEQTVGGSSWRSFEQFSTMIRGEVLKRGWQPAAWVLRPDGTLHCSSNRENNVVMITPPVPSRSVVYSVRELNTEFVVSTTQDADVRYVVELSITIDLLGANSQTASVELLVNGVSVPSKKEALDAVLGLGLSFTPTRRTIVSAHVPMGATVQLVSGGTGTVSFISGEEVLL